MVFRVLALVLLITPGLAMAYDYIRPYYDCRTDKVTGEEICTFVAVGGCTKPGLYYPENAKCEDVRNLGRPYYPLPPVQLTDPNDERLSDPEFMGEMAWVTSQVSSCACTCCHDSSTGTEAANWNISDPLIWTDHMTNRGIAIMAGRVANAGTTRPIDPADNNGFSNRVTWVPTTDEERMKQFFDQELERRNVTQEEIDNMRPF